MIRPETFAADLAAWRDQHALPLWAGSGYDRATSSTWETLDHNGHPLRDQDRRQRVQFRQASVFARQADPAYVTQAWSIFRRTMDHGFDRESGLFATWVRPDLTHLDQTHDLYDLTFGILAMAMLGHAGYDVSADIARFEKALGVLDAPQGWMETAAHRLPRRQNPHMHLFEAGLELYRLTGAAKHEAIVQRSLDVICDHAALPDGGLLEMFDADLVPLVGDAQQSEPGHIAEWIYLADQYAQIMGKPTGLPLDAMWDFVVRNRLKSGFLPNVAGGKTSRLWPQTELLKASVVMSKRGRSLAQDLTPEHLSHSIWGLYMTTPVAGGWYDHFTEDGILISDDMPASTFYHIDLAVSAAQTIAHEVPISAIGE